MTATMLQPSYGGFHHHHHHHQLQDYNGSHGNIQEVFFSMGSQRMPEGRLKNRPPSSQSYDPYYGILPDENNYHLQLNFQPTRRDFFSNINSNINNNNNNCNNSNSNNAVYDSSYEDNHATHHANHHHHQHNHHNNNHHHHHHHRHNNSTTTSKSLSSCNKKSFDESLLKDRCPSLTASSPAVSPIRAAPEKPQVESHKFSPRMSEVSHQNFLFHNAARHHRSYHHQASQNYTTAHSQGHDMFSFSNHVTGGIYYPTNDSPYCSQFNYGLQSADSLFFSPPSRLDEHRGLAATTADKNRSPSSAYLAGVYPNPSVGICGGEGRASSHPHDPNFHALKCNDDLESPPTLTSSSSMSEVVAAAVAAAAHQRANGDSGGPECDPRDLEAFAEHFKQRRIKLGATQADVGAALGKLKLPGVGSLSQSTICRFESLTLSHNNMVALKPVLQAWLCEAENAAREARMREEYLSSIGDASSAEFVDKKRKRTSIAGPEKRSLEAYFAIQPRPSGEKIAQIADKLDLRKNVVRVWFCNQRQKQKRMKFSAGSLKSSH